MKTIKKVMQKFVNEFKWGTPTREYHSPEVDVEVRHYRMPIYYDMEWNPLERESTLAIKVDEEHFEYQSWDVILPYRIQKFLEWCLETVVVD